MSSIKIRVKRTKGSTQVRTLIAHPMETGRRIDQFSGSVIPMHFIARLSVKHNQNIVATCHLGPGISKDPYFAFNFRGGAPGDTVTISWVDNLGHQDQAKATLK